MGPLPTLSINHQTLTVLEDRLQKSNNQTIRQDETTSNRERLLTASGATPIRSTVVLPMTKLALQDKDNKQTQAVTCSLGGYSHWEHCRAPNDKIIHARIA